MNIELNKEQHEFLEKFSYTELLFGSRLYQTHTEDSDYNYVRIIVDSRYEDYQRENDICRYLQNVHSFQYDHTEVNIQIIWMTERQFFSNLFSGDRNILADIVLLNKDFRINYSEIKPLHLCRTYKIIKGYLDVARRDLNLYPKHEKKLSHAFRSLMFAEFLMNNELPTVKDIQNQKILIDLPSSDTLLNLEKELRTRLSDMLTSGKLDLYPVFKEENELSIDHLCEKNQNFLFYQ